MSEKYFITQEIMECFVVVNSENKITDMFSFYSLPSSIIGNPEYKELRAAYGYYIVPGSMNIKELTMATIIKAKQKNYDVFNMLDIMDNQSVLKDLLFVKGDGYLQYYFYNWALKKKIFLPHEIGIVLM